MRQRRSLTGVPESATTPVPIFHALDHIPQARAIVLLCGPIGAGKSTLASTRWPFAHIDVSRIRAERFGGIDDPETLRGAFSVAYRELEVRANQGKLAVFDSTAVTEKVRANVQHIAGVYRIPAHVVVVDTPLALAKERNRGRAVPVPDEAVERNHAAFVVARRAIQSERWASITFLRPEAA